MEKFKFVLAAVFSLIIMMAGLTCAFIYLTPNSSGTASLALTIVCLLVSALILGPAFDYWFNVCKKLLGVTKNN